MENRTSSRRSFVSSFVWLTVTAAIAIVLLLTAVVVWLSQLTGSFIASALILGGFFGVVALLIYLLSVRDAIEQIRTEVETVYEVANAAKAGYEWLSEKIVLFLKLRETMRGK